MRRVALLIVVLVGASSPAFAQVSPTTVAPPTTAATATTVLVDEAAATRPTLSVSPDTDLVDRQVVTLMGTGWAPSTSYSVRYCGLPVAGGLESCTELAAVHTDGTGSFTTDVAVLEHFYGSYRNSLIDCRVRSCGLLVFDDVRGRVVAPVSFGAVVAGGPLFTG